MRILPRILLALSLATSGGVLHAQDTSQQATTSQTPTPAQTLGDLRKQLDDIRTTLSGKTIDVPLGDLRNQALDAQQRAEQLETVLNPQLDSLQARLTVLGPAPAKGAPPETPEMAAQRRQLDKAVADLGAQLKQAQLIDKDGQQLAGQIADLRREQFQTRLGTRTTTPFSRTFWADAMRVLPDDTTRVKALWGRLLGAIQTAWQPANRLPLILCLVGALLLLAVGRRQGERLLLGLTSRYLPEGHLRRSAMAAVATAVVTLSIGLAAQLCYLALNWNGTLDDDLDQLMQAMVKTTFFAAFLAGLSRALLSVARPSWRLPALSDQAAQRLRWFPWLLGAAELLLGAVEHINNSVGASLPSTVTSRGLLALLISGLVGVALLRLNHARRALQASGHAPGRRPLWVGLIAAAATLGVVVAWLSVIAGYIAFAFFIAWQMLWIGMIVAALYLLTYLLHDLFETLLSPHGRSGQRLQSTFGLTPSSLEQSAAVLSGASRVLLLLTALTIMLTPFGAGPQDLTDHIGHVLSHLTLGQLDIKPSDVFKAIIVFAIGLIVIRMVKRWLSDELLPKTSLEPGMQNSLITLLGYVAVVVLFALALGTAGVGLQNIAWIASALSVGIGFGLQAIVQNFISGLILLAERPVKVGDWVSLSGVEGDIKRINVRATEIQLSDRSTMIVPNSQLITQNVRNVTLANAQGRVKISLPMPLDTDAAKARQIMLDALTANPSTLATPAPVVRLDDINTSSMNFTATAYVRSPRDASAVKSDILFDILERLRAAQLPLSSPQSMVVRTLGPLGEDSPAAPFQEP
jgi:potassium-dependent mechanosensitive channel